MLKLLPTHRARYEGPSHYFGCVADSPYRHTPTIRPYLLAYRPLATVEAATTSTTESDQEQEQ